MGSKQASIVVDLRTGKDVIHVPDLIAVLSAAGYQPEVVCWLLRTSVQEIGLFCTMERACLRQPC